MPVQEAAGDEDDDGGCRSRKENLQLSSGYNKLREMTVMMMMMVVVMIIAGHGKSAVVL